MQKTDWGYSKQEYKFQRKHEEQENEPWLFWKVTKGSVTLVYPCAYQVRCNRVKKVLLRIIHYNQSGFIKGRFIGKATRPSWDITDYTESFKLPDVLLFEKKVNEWEWMGFSL